MNLNIINVSLNDKFNNLSYPIFIGNNLLLNSEKLIKKFVFKRKVIIIYDNFFSSNNKTNKYFISFVETIKELTVSVNLIGIPGGDMSKNISKLEYILEESLSFKIDRSSLIIAFGGGVIGDIAGFAASILLRGIDFIQIPTTLLAQVDSSVGGKTGINSSKSKNLIGSFHQPIAVIADIDILKTLPKREFLAGLVEVIKYGLIYDLNFFQTLENYYKDILNYDQLKLNEIISKSCQIKSLIIQNDEKENDKRALLNLGHTFGHAIESFGKYDGTIIHGEAVSIGICLAFKLSSKMGYCPQIETERVVSFFKKLNLPTSLQEVKDLPITTSNMINKFKYDKKNKNNQLTFILNEKIGKSFIKNNMDENILTNFLNDEI